MLTARERRYLMVYLPLGIVAAIVVDGVVFAAVGVSYVGAYPGYPGAPCVGCSVLTPIGTSLALSAPTEYGTGSHHWCNFTVQSAGGGIILNDLTVRVVTATGSLVPAGSSWTLVLLGVGGWTVGTYAFDSNNWTSGGQGAISSNQVFVLDTGSTYLAGQGDSFNVVGTGTFDGTLSVNIP